MIQNGRARSAADNGQDAERLRNNKFKMPLITELGAIEQLAERIAVQCSALMKLNDMYSWYQYDEDNLRAIRLAVNSMTEALDSVERLCSEVDKMELGAPSQPVKYDATAEYGNDLAAVEEITNDLSVLANAEVYVLKLIASRRRPSPTVVAAMRYLANRIRAILG